MTRKRLRQGGRLKILEVTVERREKATERGLGCDGGGSADGMLAGCWRGGNRGERRACRGCDDSECDVVGEGPMEQREGMALRVGAKVSRGESQTSGTIPLAWK